MFTGWRKGSHVNGAPGLLCAHHLFSFPESAAVDTLQFSHGKPQCVISFSLSRVLLPRQLLKTELGSFFTEYLQNQLLTKGMVILRDKIRFYEGWIPLSDPLNTHDPVHLFTPREYKGYKLHNVRQTFTDLDLQGSHSLVH